MHWRVLRLCKYRYAFWTICNKVYFYLFIFFTLAYVCVCDLISNKQLYVVDHHVFLHALRDLTRELRCLAEHKCANTHSVCLSVPLYLAISILFLLSLLCTLECTHTYTYTGTVTTTEHIIVTDFWSFSLSKQIGKTKHH